MTKLLISGTPEALLALFVGLQNRSDVVAELVADNKTMSASLPTTEQPITPRRTSKPRGSRVEYHVTRSGRSNNVEIGPKAMRVLEALRRKPMGLADLQRHFAGRINPKTVDGSVTILKTNGLIDVYSVE